MTDEKRIELLGHLAYELLQAYENTASMLIKASGDADEVCAALEDLRTELTVYRQDIVALSKVTEV